MKKIITCLLSALLILCVVGCSKENGGNESKKYTIAVPNDTSNEARALLLLENLGIIKLKEGAGILATKNDIVENKFNVEIQEVEAAQIPNIRQDVDFAVINSNYAIDAGLNPVKDALTLEGSFSAYANILSVKEGNEKEPIVLALVAALQSEKVKEFIEKTYGGSVVSTVETPTDGFDASLDYAALNGKEIKVGASPAPHAQILEVVKGILAEKGIVLTIVEYTDYVFPNTHVESGEIDANYFQHVPYLDDFNRENGTHIVSVAPIHVEPMGIYPGKTSSLDVFK